MPDLNPLNYLREIKQVITGTNQGTNCDGGYLRDIDVSPTFNTPLLVSTGVSTFGPFQVPRAYDQTTDNLQLRFLGSTAGTGSSTITVYGLLTIYSTGAAAGVASAVASAASVVNNGVFSNIGWQITGAGLQYPDAFTVALSTAGGNYQVYSAALVISDCTVAFSDYTNSQNVVTEFVGGSTQQLRTV